MRFDVGELVTLKKEPRLVWRIVGFKPNGQVLIDIFTALEADYWVHSPFIGCTYAEWEHLERVPAMMAVALEAKGRTIYGEPPSR